MISGDPDVDRALAPVVQAADPAEPSFVLVEVGETLWGVVTGPAYVLPERELRGYVVAFEILRVGTAAAIPFLLGGTEVTWFANADGDLCVAFVRDQNLPRVARVYVGWPAYIVRDEPCQISSI